MLCISSGDDGNDSLPVGTVEFRLFHWQVIDRRPSMCDMMRDINLKVVGSMEYYYLRIKHYAGFNI